MKIINLRDYYPSLYTSDYFIEVPDEVENVFIASKQSEAAYQRRKYYSRAQYSLDRDDGIEQHILYKEPPTEEIYERKLTTEQLLAAISALPDKQAKHIYAHYFLGLSRSAIAKAESITERAVNMSISDGLQNIVKFLKKFF